MKNKKSLKNLKQFRVKSKFLFYIVFRPMAQKWFFPICALILLAGILNYEYDQRGVWVFENAKASVSEESSAEGEALSKSVGDDKDGTLADKAASVAVPAGGTQVSSVSGAVIEAKIKEAFPHSPEIALAIAKGESGLDPHKPSNTDITKDGHVYSWGLFQINLTVTNIDGVACNEAFEGRNNNATVKNMKLYKQCVKLATDPEKNIAVAVKKYEGRGNYTAWGAYTNGSYKRHL